MSMNWRLADKNGRIIDAYHVEVVRRVRVAYSAKQEKDILRNMLTDTDAAVAYAEHVRAVKAEVKAEIESVLGHSVDVGFDPKQPDSGVTHRVENLEASTEELSDALNMNREGVGE